MNYKGMDKDMKCRGFQYEIGGEYEEETAEVCKRGFHACEYPLDVFDYYSPATSRFFKVVQSGVLIKGAGDTKVASTKIKIVEEAGISGLVEAAVEYTNKRCTQNEGDKATGYQGAASATGDQGAASATGKSSVALAAGISGKAKGALGCAIFLVERGEWDGETYPILCAKAAIVDGDTVKPNTWYTLENGDLVEVKE